MASQKRLQSAAIKFRKENSRLSNLYSELLSNMATFIRKTGAPEVIVGLKNGEYYEHTND